MNTLVPNAVIDSVAQAVSTSSSWMLTPQATTMRLLPEQMSATQWWKAEHGEIVDIDTSVPAWISYYYGVTADADDNQAPAAAAVAAMLRTRASILADSPVHLVADEDVRRIIVTLAQTRTYQSAVGGWPASRCATVLFANPLPFQHPTPDHGLDEYLPTPSSPIAAATPQLKAISWYADGRILRCLDWVTPQLESTGSDYADAEIAKHVRGIRNAGLPAMIGNAEWRRRITGIDDEQACRDRITTAAAEVADGATARWDGADALDDTNATLAPALASALADALTAGIVRGRRRQSSKVRKRRRRSTPVTLIEPA